MTSRPWSAGRERHLTIAKDILCYMVLGSFAAAGGAAVKGSWPLAGWCVLVMVFFILCDLIVMEKIKEMQPNKPRGDMSRMTRWRFWPHDTGDFDCNCRTRLSFTHSMINRPAAQWSPNAVTGASDPGGGRWCIVCTDCGRGHYKFNVDPRTDPARDRQ